MLFKSCLKAFGYSSVRQLMSTSKSSAPLLITPAEAAKLSSSGQQIAFVDATWVMPNVQRVPREEFVSNRLPRARFFNLDEIASFSEEGEKLNLKHMIPTPEVFAAACENMGINPETHVILYDTHGVFSSPRALFTFRAFSHNNSSVLNGGLPRWIEEGYKFESGDLHGAAFSAARYPPPKFNADVIRSYAQMVNNAAHPLADSKTEIVLDARARGRYLGVDPEPRPGLSSGHIPNSFSLPFSHFTNTHMFSNEDFLAKYPTFPFKMYTTLAEPNELKQKLIKSIGHDNANSILSGQRRVVTTCGSGMTAAVLWLGLSHILESQQKSLPATFSLYDESWTGYAGRPGSKIEKAEKYKEYD